MTTRRVLLPGSLRLTVVTALTGSLIYFAPAAFEIETARGANIAKKVIRAHNKERRKRKLPKLRRKGQLNRAAQKYASLMAAVLHPLSHTGPAPDFSTFDQRIQAEGFRKFPIGENIAKGQRSIQSVMRAWMNSRGHRKNILNRRYRSVGAGKANSAEGPYWVVTFGG